MFFCWCALSVIIIIPMTNLMNVSCGSHSNLTLYLPELEVRRFNYLMSPLPSYLSLWRVKLVCLDSNLPVEMRHMEDASESSWSTGCWTPNTNLLDFIIFHLLTSDADGVWRSPKPSEFRSHLVESFVFRPSSWPKSITASPCWSSGSRWSRGCCTRSLEPERTRWTWLKM